MSKPTKPDSPPPRAKKYASLVAKTKLTRSAFAERIGVRPECITRRCSGEENFREESMLAAEYLAKEWLV